MNVCKKFLLILSINNSIDYCVLAERHCLVYAMQPQGNLVKALSCILFLHELVKSCLVFSKKDGPLNLEAFYISLLQFSSLGLGKM